MKRFVTYLYECERGNKSKNVGFIRVNVRGEEMSMEVYIRNLRMEEDEGKLYFLIYEDRLQGVEAGAVRIRNGQSDTNIKNTRLSMDAIEGIGICLASGTYIASCWKDQYSDEIIRAEFSMQENLDEEKHSLMAAEDVNDSKEDISANEEYPKDSNPSYEKIDLSQIRDLPSPNWHLATNSFLVHGFWNYGYLVLKKVVEEGQKKLALGVPGIYERPEAVMAVLFGFPNFEMVSQEMTILEKEKNQETKVGTMGCWFVDLKM